jgi:alkanesulfonate monooxygenase SsuD/methylene tetrahydromethanopterin reductase-like flavin-dependent oxidoreductase (luciferase family)
MEFGLFMEFASPPGVSEAAAFDESLGQMKAAEDMGFDAVWLAEIHFQKDRSVLASPLVIASALAACTRRVKIGIAVQVFPLSHPLRLAEDVATVDHISKGRLEFGVGRSGLPGHYQGFNIPHARAARGDGLLDALDVDEPRRDHPHRARAQVDASLCRARRTTVGVSRRRSAEARGRPPDRAG